MGADASICVWLSATTVDVGRTLPVTESDPQCGLSLSVGNVWMKSICVKSLSEVNLMGGVVFLQLLQGLLLGGEAFLAAEAMILKMLS